MFRFRTFAPLLGVHLVLALNAAGQGDPVLTAAVKKGVSWDAFVARLGPSFPTGAGVVCGQCEPASSPGYWPDITHPEFAGKTFTFVSGRSVVTPHATLAGQHFYGTKVGVAPGPTEIFNYSPDGMLGPDFLQGTAVASPPLTVPWRVLKNGAHGTMGHEAEVYLRKMDWAIRDQDLIVVSGSGNGAVGFSAPSWPHLFNGISVGRSDGGHKSGPTLPSYDGPGRQKPEIVAPQSASSYTGPIVAGGVTVLIETAATHPALSFNPSAERSEVLKAVVLAGAEHRPGWANNAPQSGPTRGLATNPLDPVFGVDEFDLNHSHWILTGAEQDGTATAIAATTKLSRGWDLDTIASGESRFWRFDVGPTNDYMSVVATWHRAVLPAFNGFVEPDIDMELYQVDGGGALVSMVGSAGLPLFEGGNTRSASPVDNLEHIYVNGLAPGEYVLALERAPDGKIDFDFGIAWEIESDDPVSYCSAGSSAAGCQALLSGFGTPSASATSGFNVIATGAEGNKDGLFFFNTNGRQANSWGSGTSFQCVVPPVYRGGLLIGNGTQGKCDNNLSQDMNALWCSTCPKPAKNPGSGAVVQCQLWYRDPMNTSNQTTSLSDAIEFTVVP